MEWQGAMFSALVGWLVVMSFVAGWLRGRRFGFEELLTLQANVVDARAEEGAGIAGDLSAVLAEYDGIEYFAVGSERFINATTAACPFLVICLTITGAVPSLRDDVPLLYGAAALIAAIPALVAGVLQWRLSRKCRSLESRLERLRPEAWSIVERFQQSIRANSHE